MRGWRTRGHVAAARAVAAMVRGPAAHAVLLVGPAGVGKTTLAADLAAGLLCVAPDPADRPCGACRGCRLVARGAHPDLHVLRPEGAGRQVVIGGPGSKARGVRDLIADLALLPVEGGARVAIIESAHRMNEDAQAALLKTLEEPPAGVTIVLCADAEEPLLPTIRSRCARLRLGPVGPRDVEAILAEHGVADPGQAARLARLAGGRPGQALAWAADAEVARLRDELSRTLLDLLHARPADRLAAIRSAAARSGALADVMDGGGVPSGERAPEPRVPVARGKGRRTGGASAVPIEPPTDPDAGSGVTDAAARGDEAAPEGPADSTTADADEDRGTTARAPAAQRRRAAEAVITVWIDVARDLLLARIGALGSLRDPRLLEELTRAAATLDPPALSAFLDRLGRAGVLLSSNVAPELVLDDLAIAWPPRAPIAA